MRFTMDKSVTTPFRLEVAENGAPGPSSPAPS
jgi:hypothetical protein